MDLMQKKMGHSDLKAISKCESFAFEHLLSLKQEKAMSDFAYSLGIVFE